METKEEFRVLPITSKQTHPWLLNIHYAKRVCNISHAYGLFKNDVLVGCITFGQPPNPTEETAWKPFKLIELNRLVVKEGLGKNVLSFFVAQALKLLPQRYVIVSYADIDQGHTGYIYQSTNWIYTGIGGKGVETYVMKSGRERHNRKMELVDMKEVVAVKKASGKHRYYYFLGKRKDKETMKEMLLKRFQILPYPKSENKRYLIDKHIPQQRTL